jgi:hypothetical protein
MRRNNSTSSSQTAFRAAPWLVGLFILLALILIGGVLLFYTTYIQPKPLSTESGTQTAAALAHMSPSELYRYITSKTPEYADALRGDKPGKWDTYMRDGGGCVFREGALHVIASQQEIAPACYIHNAIFRNFAFQVQMTPLLGSTGNYAGGLAFRVHLVQQTSYSFELFSFPTNTYTFLATHDGSNPAYTLNDSDPRYVSNGNSSIRTGIRQSNVLTVIVLDTTFYLYTNGTYLTKVLDTSYRSGKIGIFAFNAGVDLSVDVAFTNAKVWLL